MTNSEEFELNRRRDRLAVSFTNSYEYDELGFGLQDLIDYTIELEDLVREERPLEPMRSDTF